VSFFVTVFGMRNADEQRLRAIIACGKDSGPLIKPGKVGVGGTAWFFGMDGEGGNRNI
jgi:hypothetical protein